MIFYIWERKGSKEGNMAQDEAVDAGSHIEYFSTYYALALLLSQVQ